MAGNASQLIGALLGMDFGSLVPKSEDSLGAPPAPLASGPAPAAPAAPAAPTVNAMTVDPSALPPTTNTGPMKDKLASLLDGMGKRSKPPGGYAGVSPLEGAEGPPPAPVATGPAAPLGGKPGLPQLPGRQPAPGNFDLRPILQRATPMIRPLFDDQGLS